jgi:hypothetical protein
VGEESNGLAAQKSQRQRLLEVYIASAILLSLSMFGCVGLEDESASNENEVEGIVPSSTAPAEPLKGLATEEAMLPVPTTTPAPLTYYVSKNGLNIDGRSWDTAWNELDQIDWDLVRPGDLIVLDGGATEMGYASTLTIGKSGTSERPITLTLSEEPGRDGQVIIFGGRSTALPYCDQTDYVYETEGVRSTGIDARDAAWIIIDGQKWRGIAIHGHNRTGVRLSDASSHITVRYVEIYDNGRAIKDENGNWYPELPGVGLSGTYVTFERAIIHDNGEDAFQSGGGVGNFTLRQSWLYQGRQHPDREEPFNQCRHPDGIQVYGGGSQSGFTIEESVIGPGFMQGVILGQQLIPPDTQAIVNDVVLRHMLFSKANNSNIVAYPNTGPQNWTMDHITSHCHEGCNNFYLEGSGHSITNSIFEGGRIDLPDGLDRSSGNCTWLTREDSLGTVVDPQFVDVTIDPFSLDNYALAPGSPCEGKGSYITSVEELFALPEDDEMLSGLAWEAEAGEIFPPFTVQQGTGTLPYDYVFQPVETLDPIDGGRLLFRFIAPVSGRYIITAMVNAPDDGANSVFVNVDAEPTSPTMIWDMEVTDGFEERTVAWRGNGTVKLPELEPKVFDLLAWRHEIIIRGREAGTLLDRVGVRLVENKIFMPLIEANQ